MARKICSRCHCEHDGKFDTCDECRAYNNANKMIYAWAETWELPPDVVREGLQKALAARDGRR